VQNSMRCAQGAHDFRERLEIAGDHAVVPHLTVPSLFGERDIDRFLVDLHPHEHVTFRHDLPPLVCGSARRLRRLE
jgi:hypothetical protein